MSASPPKPIVAPEVAAQGPGAAQPARTPQVRFAEPARTIVRYEVVSDRHGDLLRRLETEWEDLAASSLERNPFYEPPALSAARVLLDGRKVDNVLVFDVDAKGDRRLSGLVPCLRRHTCKHLPLRTLEVWGYLYCELTVPLVRASCAPGVVSALLEWFDSGAAKADVLLLPELPAASAFAELLLEAGGDRPVWEEERYERAMLELATTAEEYIRAAMSANLRRSLKRLRKRLAEHGEVTTDRLEADSEVERWAAEFLDLEASGWKGTSGTALAAAGHGDFFRRLVRGGYADRTVDLLALRLDGRPLAMACNLRSGDAGFVFKIAYDEAFAKYSPGFLLQEDVIREVHEAPRALSYMDSCAGADHPMFDRIWGGRRSIVSLTVPRDRMVPRAVVRNLPALRRVRERVPRTQR